MRSRQPVEEVEKVTTKRDDGAPETGDENLHEDGDGSRVHVGKGRSLKPQDDKTGISEDEAGLSVHASALH